MDNAKWIPQCQLDKWMQNAATPCGAYVVTLRPELPGGKDSRAPRVIHPTKGGHEPEPEPEPPPDLMI